MTKRLPSIPNVALKLTERDIYDVLDPLKRIIDIRNGEFDPLERWVTMQDLVDFGLQTESAVSSPIPIVSPTVVYDFSLNGDIVGGPNVMGTGDPVIMATIINLPNITLINGGDAADTYPEVTTGPFGAVCPPPLTGEFCPGYTYVFVDVDTWKVENIDVTDLFYVGRRLSFTEGALTYYGVITASTFSTDTTIDMDMEGPDVLTIGITDVCLVSGSISWGPIATDPFSGSSINAIATGVIGATQFWIAVGDNGKIFHSTDKGATWSAATSNTGEKLTCIAYDYDNERFMVGGHNRVILTTTSGTVWALAQNIPITDGTGNINAIDYNSVDAIFTARYSYNSGSVGSDINYTLTFGASWTGVRTHSVAGSGVISTDRSRNTFFGRGDQIYVYTGRADTSASAHGVTDPAVGLSTSSLGWTLETGVYYLFLGHDNGMLTHINDLSPLVFEDITPPWTFAVNAMAHSPLNSRTIIVGDSASIAYLEDSSLGADGGLVGVTSNGFSPATDITDVAWNEVDAIFVAVASNGQIARSTSGIN